MPPGMPSMAQARNIQGIPSGASDQEKVSCNMFTITSALLFKELPTIRNTFAQSIS